MASTFKSAVAQNIGTSPVTIYTCPAATQTTIIGMTACNTTGSAVTCDVTYVKGGVTVYLVRNAPLPVGGSLVLIGGDQKVVCEVGNNIRVQSSAASSVDVLLSLLEIT